MCADHNADQTTDDFSYKRVIREVSEKYKVEQDERFEAILRRVWRLKSDEVRKLRLHFKKELLGTQIIELIDIIHPWIDRMTIQSCVCIVEYINCDNSYIGDNEEHLFELSVRISAEPMPYDILIPRYAFVLIRPLEGSC